MNVVLTIICSEDVDLGTRHAGIVLINTILLIMFKFNIEI